jgi:hypothetical protein
VSRTPQILSANARDSVVPRLTQGALPGATPADFSYLFHLLSRESGWVSATPFAICSNTAAPPDNSQAREALRAAQAGDREAVARLLALV